MDIFAFSQAEFLSFILTLMRVSLLVFLMPFFGGENLPTMGKALICIIVTLTIWPRLSLDMPGLDPHPLTLILLLLSELILGLTMALCVHFVFAAIQTGGDFIGFQMGLTMVSIMDPASGARVSVTSQILYMVTMLIFLSLNGHLHILRALIDSFALIPPGGILVSPPLVSTIIRLSANIFVVAIKIAAPVMVALFMVELALALMGRAAPQMNLMTMGFPLKISVGFFFLGLLFSIMANHVEDFIVRMAPMFQHILRLASPETLPL